MHSDKCIFIIAHLEMNLGSLTALRCSICLCVHVCGVCVYVCVHKYTEGTSYEIYY
jgi:hypothetical protein